MDVALTTLQRQLHYNEKNNVENDNDDNDSEIIFSHRTVC